MKNSILRKSLALLLVGGLAAAFGCAEPEDETDIDEVESQMRMEGDERLAEHHVHDHGHDDDHHGAMKRIIVNNVEEAQSLFKGGTAHFEMERSFQQLGARLDADDISRLQYRAPQDDGTWSDWQNVQITWNHGQMYNILVVLDDPVSQLEMRGGDDILHGVFEFQEEIIASPRVLDGEEEDVELRESLEDDGQKSSDVNEMFMLSTSGGPDIVSRSQWGARAALNIQSCATPHSPSRASIHHTTGSQGGDPAARMRGYQNFHMDTNGWCDIGYHFIVFEDGQILEGRDHSRVGTHVGGQNTNNIGISLSGNFSGSTAPSEASLDAAGAVLGWVHNHYGVPLNRNDVRGHQEWPGQSTACPGANLLPQIEAIIDRAAGGGAEPDPTYNVDLDVRMIHVDDFYADGSSRGIADALPGQEFRAEIDLTNQSDERIEGVEIGYQFETPFIRPTHYTIHDDHDSHDKSSWRLNSADPSNSADNSSSLSEDGTLQMHGFAPGETKRVTVWLEANQYSIGQASLDHPDVRAWLVHIDDVFEDSAGSWGDVAPKTELEDEVRYVRARAKVDVLSRDEWSFDSMADDADLEGWTTCYPGHHDDLIHNTNHGALSLDVSGDRACVTAPDWAQIDADRFDEMVIEFRSHEGAHDKTVFWASESDLPAEQFPCAEVERVAGPDRYASAAAVAQSEFPNGADMAVLVLGDRPTSDTIVAASLASHHDGPLLLTPADELHESTRAELSRLDPDRVLIVGGTSAVDSDVEAAVDAMGLNPERRAGADRFSTAVDVARDVGAPTGTAVILSAANENLIDGVYGTALAAELDAPILLAQGDLLPSQVRDVIDDLGITETILVGGTAALSQNVEDALPSPLRIAGANRYETANEVANFIFDGSNVPHHAFIARDDNIIDAFSAAATGEVVLLSRPEGLTQGVSQALTGHAESATLVGGTAALSEDVARDACDAFRLQDAVDTTRALSFEAYGDSEFQTLVVPIGEMSEWSGLVSYLAIMPQYGKAPASGESPWQDIGKIYFQNSATQETSSDIHGYATGTQVDVEEVENAINPAEGYDDGTGSSNNSGDNVDVENGCSSIGAGNGPTGDWMLLVLMGLAVAWRRQS